MLVRVSPGNIYAKEKEIMTNMVIVTTIKLI
jgi:hypothetical protein